MWPPERSRSTTMLTTNILVICFICGLSDLAVAQRSARQVSPRGKDGVNDSVTAVIGTTASLPCRLPTEGKTNASISWVRNSDFHVLTVEAYTYTSDDRFYNTRDEQGGNWMLNIKFVQVRDTGIYVCQQSNTKATYHVYLNVLENRAYIVGGTERYLVSKSDFILTCSVSSPLALQWYHNDKLLNHMYNEHLDITTSLGLENSTSILTVFSARLQDSGNYTCVPSNGRGYSTTVHILRAYGMDEGMMVSRGSIGSSVTALTFLGITITAAAIFMVECILDTNMV